MKLSADILAQIKEIEVQTSRLVSGMLIGDKQSAIKGVGFEFDQIRDYQIGDDVRSIDWKSSARLDKILVKQYIEEHNRIIMLVVDGSASGLCSSVDDSKYTIIARIASVLALVAQRGKDHVGLLLFTDKIEHYIPPRMGRHHIHMIMQILFSWQPKQNQSTDIAAALQHILHLRLMPSIVCLISDLISKPFEKILVSLCRRHDFIVIRCLDAIEHSFPRVGIIHTIDLETGQSVVLDARSVNNNISTFVRSYNQKSLESIKRYSASMLNIMVNKPFIYELVRFFGKRLYS